MLFQPKICIILFLELIELVYFKRAFFYFNHEKLKNIFTLLNVSIMTTLGSKRN